LSELDGLELERGRAGTRTVSIKRKSVRVAHIKNMKGGGEGRCETITSWGQKGESWRGKGDGASSGCPPPTQKQIYQQRKNIMLKEHKLLNTGLKREGKKKKRQRHGGINNNPSGTIPFCMRNHEKDQSLAGVTIPNLRESK